MATNNVEPSHQELEAELEATLVEQREALAQLDGLGDDGLDEEMRALREELRGGLAATEAAVLELKKARLLAHLGGVAQERQQQQQQSLQVEQQRLTAGLVRWRHIDGRWYLGFASAAADGGSTCAVRFATPTRRHHLGSHLVPTAHLLPLAAEVAAPPTATDLPPGRRVVVKPPGGQLWAAAEVVAADGGRQLADVVLLSDHQRLRLPLSTIALSAFAPDPHAAAKQEEEEEEEEDARQPLSHSCSSSSEGEEGDGSGSDEGGSGGSEGEEEGGDGGGQPYARVSAALADAATLAEQQAAAGQQSETALFHEFEKHSRGIGSKLLAQMGFKGGGLGRRQQGIAAALTAVRLKPRAGLGVAPAGGAREGRKRRRKQSGRERRASKAAKVAFDAREAVRAKQAALERKTGNVGMFAVLDSLVGDSSRAHAVAKQRGRDAGADAGGSARQPHLFTQQQQGQGQGQEQGPPPGSGGARKAASAAAVHDSGRRLAAQQDQVAALQDKVAKLQAMLQRQAKDPVIGPQVRRALAEAQQQLAAAEGVHRSSIAAAAQKRQLAKLTKF